MDIQVSNFIRRKYPLIEGQKKLLIENPIYAEINFIKRSDYSRKIDRLSATISILELNL